MVIKTLKNFSAPKEEGCLFTWPDFKHWASLLEENIGLLSYIDDRKLSRNELLNIAADYTCRIGIPGSSLKNTDAIIVTGHQPNWHHCGILAKNIITDKFNRQINGTAIHLVLDHDICSTTMTLPERDSDDSLHFKTIPLESKRQKLPLEFRPVPSKEQLAGFIDAVSGIHDTFCSDVWCWNFKEMLSCENIADIIAQLHAQLYEALKLAVFYLPISRMSESDCFTDFVCSIIDNASVFTTYYNQAILYQQQLCKLKSNQTLRLLKTDDHHHVFELPFWLVSQAGTRASLFVDVKDDTIKIGTKDIELGTIDSSENKKDQFLDILGKTQHIIRPKAAMLTLFVRLYLADWFVHGTGASNYEYITDDLIKNYYGLSKLNFGVVTATMMLPEDSGYQDSQIAELCLQRRNKFSKKVVNNREFFFGLFSRQRLDNLVNSNEAENENSHDCCSSPR